MVGGWVGVTVVGGWVGVTVAGGVNSGGWVGGWWVVDDD